MPSRDPEHLHPALRPLHAAWLAACKQRGIHVLTTCTYRPQSEQDELYAIGRTRPGTKVTWTRTSRHSEKLGGFPASSAWDFVPLVNGKPSWKETDPAWEACGVEAELLGLEWGGRWGARKRDMPHIQMKR